MPQIESDSPTVTQRNWPPGQAYTPPRLLLLLPDRNVKEHDWSGAFRVEASRTAALYQVPPEMIVQIDVGQTRVARLHQLLNAIEQRDGLARVDVYCHGWKGGLQLGPRIEDAGDLARMLAPRARPDLAVALYACSAGGGEDPDGEGPAPGGEGGFADALRDALVAEGLAGAHVDAHTIVGHCCRNPFVRRFSAATALGGEWLIAPEDPLFLAWRKRLRETDLRLRYPLMSPQAIRNEVGP